MPDQTTFPDVSFPFKGLDVSRGFHSQRPLTTPVGTNVRAYEPTTDRARGGSRPMLARYSAGQSPAGAHLIQDLNFVVRTSETALLTSDGPPDPDPLTGLPPIDDPSDAGPPFSWGTTPIVFDNSGNPVINPATGTPYSGLTEMSRNPGGPGSSGGVTPRKVRHGGDAGQPSKNLPQIVTAAPIPPATPKRCFMGSVTIRVSKPAGQDIFNFNGQEPTFYGTECRLYNPPTIPGPLSADAKTFDSIQSQIAFFMAYRVNSQTWGVPNNYPGGTYTILGQTMQIGGACSNVGRECSLA